MDQTKARDESSRNFLEISLKVPKFPNTSFTSNQRGRSPSAPTLPHSPLLRPNLSPVIPTPCNNLPLKRFHAAIAIVGLQRRCYCERAGVCEVPVPPSNNTSSAATLLPMRRISTRIEGFVGFRRRIATTSRMASSVSQLNNGYVWLQPSSSLPPPCHH